jgi:hypothetical protein
MWTNLDNFFEIVDDTPQYLVPIGLNGPKM